MYITFSKYKANYKRGQLTPFFIALIAVLVIVVFVTINVGKISSIKTHTANAADAGALAGGSVMAAVFNSQAVMNSQMIAQYETFFATVSLLFTSALVALIVAHVKASAGLAFGKGALDDACLLPCVALGEAGSAVTAIGSSLTSLVIFISLTKAIMAAVTGFWLSQLFFYLIMRDQAKKGRISAVEMAYYYAFINSGISSKLKTCRLEDTSLCSDCENGCEGDCQQECGDDKECLDACSRGELRCLIDNCDSQQADFQLWLKDIGSGSHADYKWQDGQDRAHRVRAKVKTQKVDTYRLRSAVLPYPAEMAALGTIVHIAIEAQTALTLAGGKYTAAMIPLGTACGCKHCCKKHKACCICQAVSCAAAEVLLGVGIAANTEGISNIVSIYPLLALAWAGLAPGIEFTDSSGWGSAWAILCWVEDIKHDRLFSVTEWQAHQGEDYGLWKTKYPSDWDGISDPSAKERIRSYSLVNFRGHGKINPPEQYFDASIQEAE